VLLHRPLPLLLRLLHQPLAQLPHVEALLLQAAQLLAAEEVVVLVADVVVDAAERAQHRLDPSHLIRPRTCSLPTEATAFTHSFQVLPMTLCGALRKPSRVT